MNYNREFFIKDFLSSIVVFLVALPLCMGIAIASGVDPILGLISGIIGGLIVGTFSGAPFQVSGPAAGLAIMVFEFVDKFGLSALAPLGLIVGLTQILIFKFRLAEYFRAMSPALIKGLLSGIGFLILTSQVHVAFDTSPIGSGLVNLVKIPASFNEFVILEGGGRMAFLIAMTTLISILLWRKFAGKLGQIIPAPLFAIIVVVVGNSIFETGVKKVFIPENIFDQLNTISGASFSLINGDFIIAALAIAFVASAETLLSVTAVDKMTPGHSSNYNKEILAQGLGNSVAGLLGALPITGVIVRSSANVESGAKTRMSAVMHGIWLFVLVFFLTDVLALIPISALAGVLIFVGWRLLDVTSIPALYRRNKAEFVIFVVTFTLIVSVDLLTGVVIGFLTSLVLLLQKLHSLELNHKKDGEDVVVHLAGSASFLKLPEISRALKAIDSGAKKVVIDLESVSYIDWAVEDEIQSFKDSSKDSGIEVVLKEMPKK